MKMLSGGNIHFVTTHSVFVNMLPILENVSGGEDSKDYQKDQETHTMVITQEPIDTMGHR
jgi:hypothetical protein